MSLKNMKIKGKSYQSPFTNLMEPLDDVVEAVKEGRWDDLTKSHMRLGCTIAGRYVSVGANSDEMVSAAMLGICTAVDKIKKKGLKHDNVTGYIVHYIHQFCSEVLRKDTVVPMPRGKKVRPVLSLLDTGENDFDIIEFEDTLEKIIKTEQEGEIITLRRLGFTDAAVAEKLDISQSRVIRIRHDLYKRFQKS